MSGDGLEGVRLFRLQAFESPTGSLVPVEEMGRLPFPVERLFFVRNVPAGAMRGGHAYGKTEQIVVPILGRVRVMVADREGREARYELDPGEHAIRVPAGVWLETTALDDDATFGVLSSRRFDPADAVRDREAFEAGEGP